MRYLLERGVGNWDEMSEGFVARRTLYPKGTQSEAIVELGLLVYYVLFELVLNFENIST